MLHSSVGSCQEWTLLALLMRTGFVGRNCLLYVKGVRGAKQTQPVWQKETESPKVQSLKCWRLTCKAALNTSFQWLVETTLNRKKTWSKGTDKRVSAIMVHKHLDGLAWLDEETIDQGNKHSNDHLVEMILRQLLAHKLRYLWMRKWRVFK